MVNQAQYGNQRPISPEEAKKHADSMLFWFETKMGGFFDKQTRAYLVKQVADLISSTCRQGRRLQHGSFKMNHTISGKEYR